MKKFLNDDFLLNNDVAKILYHEHAKKMPIIDYHCHLNPEEIAKNIKFKNITHAWLGGDHYKWRLMRVYGVDESLITGDKDDFEKFKAFTEVIPYCVGNPVYVWTHLELKRFFECDLIIKPENAKEIWDFCNDKLQNDNSFTSQGLIKKFNVTTLVTTDDPIDSLNWHEEIKKDLSFDTKVLPAWRPDKIITIEKDIYNNYIKNLSQASKIQIKDFDSIKKALINRMDYFEKLGCKASDHGINSINYYPATNEELNLIVIKKLSNKELSNDEVLKYQYNILKFLGEEYYKRDWVFEIHYGAGRNANTKMFERLGADTGYDYISPFDGARGLQNLLDELNIKNSLPKTILFSLNPNDDAILNTIVGCFQKEGEKGYIQHGAAWWFNDTKEGMISHLTNFSNLFVLGSFVGMLTDSRSFLSYPRHEYFRRIICNLIGEWIENGEYPEDISVLSKIVEDISYNNAINFFGYNN